MLSSLKVAISPCPNDTYVFGPWLLGLTGEPAPNLSAVDFCDIQELNSLALKGEHDLIKISAVMVPRISDVYQVMHCGAALGDDCGPLLVARSPEIARRGNWRVALPGADTTASYLFHSAFPGVNDRVDVVFSEVEKAVLSGAADVGVLIHETRFNYADKGLHLVTDLGALWTQRSGTPIPLGLIAIRRNLPESAKALVAAALSSSILLAKVGGSALEDFIRSHAAEMDDEAIRKHIALYVNYYTRNLGIIGEKAVRTLAACVAPERELPPDLFYHI
ncbi:MAG: 1,4-dihydroxy-6-naphthoate synthase [Saprospiraceae bacterium]|nr:1,4-dihydroxy-6-naphthoate synthase [Saprospiraceae bacterium]